MIAQVLSGIMLLAAIPAWAQSESEATIPEALAHAAKAPEVDIASLRDPFESYLQALEKRRRRATTRRNRPLEPLERFDLSALKLVATFKRGKTRVAMVEDPSGRGYIIRRGSRIGRNNGRVEKITDDTVYIVEEVIGPGGDLIERQTTLTLKEVSAK